MHYGSLPGRTMIVIVSCLALFSCRQVRHTQFKTSTNKTIEVSLTHVTLCANIDHIANKLRHGNKKIATTLFLTNIQSIH